MPGKHHTVEFETLEREDEILTQVIIEDIANDDLLAQNVRTNAPRLSITDEFSIAMLDIRYRIIICHTVFAGRVMKDIQNVLKTRVRRVYADLRILAESC